MSKKTNRCVVPTRPNQSKKNYDQLSVIILAASQGYRMKSYGPKSLLKASNGKTILENQISNIKSIYKDCEIVVVAGFDADSIIKNKPDNCRIVENQLYEESGEVEQLRLGLNNIENNKVLIINDGVHFNKESIKDITQDGSCLLVDEDQLSNDEIGVTIVDNKVTILSYAINDYKWCNISYFTGKELDMIKSFCSNREKKKLFMFECLNEILEKKIKITAHNPTKKSLIKINSSSDIPKLKKV